jgi:hypothetical protein
MAMIGSETDPLFRITDPDPGQLITDTAGSEIDKIVIKKARSSYSTYVIPYTWIANVNFLLYNMIKSR